MADKRWNLATPIDLETPRHGKTTRWTRCGVMFEGKKPGTFSILLDSLPTNGRLTAFPHDAEKDVADE